jgi:lipid-A-disaccharide synthase-like uncharacterized protein
LTVWEWVGWLGNGCFFLRIALLWWHAERTRTNQAPRLVWILSLAGSVLLGCYAYSRGAPVLLAGFVINGLIYSRNLRLEGPESRKIPTFWAALLGAGALAVLVASGAAGARIMPTESLTWIVIAVLGQGIWSSRFVVQWWQSEQRESSYFPPAFWLVSLAGNLLLLSYAIHLRDPVFMAGLVFGPVIQVRNLMISRAAELHIRSPGLPTEAAAAPGATGH